MSARQIVVVRHGQTEWSDARRHTGRTDIPLTDLGRRQADALAGMLEAFEFDAVVSSPLARAWETMERARLGPDGVADDDLMEWDYGVYEGRRTVDIRDEIPGWSVWTHPIPGGESLAGVGERVDRAIARALEAGETVAVFGHAHLLRIFAARWVGLPPEAGRHLQLDTATVSVLGWERENRVIHRWNHVCPAAGR
ncbi:MAG: histidine phosphatase family protein [Actinobacteria bacterium]|nr:histidine phosphatase family protein [Actinomycetota bacterium]